MYIYTKYDLTGERSQVLVKFLVQISFIVNLCLIFVYSKYVDGSDSRRNRLYFDGRNHNQKLVWKGMDTERGRLCDYFTIYHTWII